VIVRDAHGVEHYGRLKFGQTAPPLGPSVDLAPSPLGANIKGSGRQGALGRG
jgi:hypothetical protein